MHPDAHRKTHEVEERITNLSTGRNINNNDHFVWIELLLNIVLSKCHVCQLNQMNATLTASTPKNPVYFPRASRPWIDTQAAERILKTYREIFVYAFLTFVI